MNDKYKPTRKVGAYNGDKTKRWDGKKWVPVNVVHRGQRATLNGKPVVADGNGNWRSPGSRGNSLQGNRPGRVVGSYQPGDRKSEPTKVNTPRPNNAAAINARLKEQRAARERARSRSPGSNNSQILREAPSSSRSTPPSSTPSRTPSRTPSSTPSRARAPQSSDMSANMKAWAKAHPELAKKVKKNQSGYKDIASADPSTVTKPSSNSTSRSANWISENYRPGGPKKQDQKKDEKKKKRTWLADNYNPARRK